jgi:molecular chaperone DnaK (HSP70)
LVMVYVQTSKDKLENLKERLIIEIVEQQKKVNNSSNPVEKKISMINWTLDTIDSNPNMTTQELADLIEYRVEGIEREIDNAESKDELTWIFDEIRILEGIRSTVRIVG